MLRADILIKEARVQTGNTQVNSDTGLPDSTYIRALNDAQDDIHSGILLQNPDILEKVKILNVTAQQEAYDLPADVFGTSRIVKVEYSLTGQDKNYYELDSATKSERLNGPPGSPFAYIRQSEQLLIQPKPQGAGTLRITYEKVIPRLDKRRGKISDVTLDNTAKTITNLVIDPTILTTDDVEVFNEYEFLCIVSKQGQIKMKGIPISGVNSTTGQVTIDPFNFEDGETIAVGDFVVAGRYSTTHSELPDITERYLLAFAVWRALKGDSSNDSREENEELNKMFDSIMATYARPDKSLKTIPIIDTDFM